MVDRNIYNLAKGFALLNSEVSNNWYSEFKYHKYILKVMIDDMEYNKYEELDISPAYYYDILDWLIDKRQKFELLIEAHPASNVIAIKKVKQVSADNIEG